MGVMKIKPEGGQGGKKGHSNMDHWVTSAEHKNYSRKRRRLLSRKLTRNGVDEHHRSKKS